MPSGKVRDCTLAFMEDGARYLLAMSSAGHIYYQSLSDESSARHGPFYVTSIMDVRHSDIKVNISTSILIKLINLVYDRKPCGGHAAVSCGRNCGRKNAAQIFLLRPCGCVTA